MLPHDLQPADFAAYTPQARALAQSNLPILQQLPISFLPALLSTLIEYDYKFPKERDAINAELAYLNGLTPAHRTVTFQQFASLNLSSDLQSLDWVNHPSQFLERQSAFLWSSHQIDAYRSAALQYGDQLRAATPAAPLPTCRLGIAVIGQGASPSTVQLFLHLRAHGTHFTNVDPGNGLEALLAAVETRAQVHPAPYSHWYVDGGLPPRPTPSLTTISYASLEPVRARLLHFMQAEISRSGMGPEDLRSDLARLLPTDLGMALDGDPVLHRFAVRLFTEGSGTQIFSTTFAQWATREALRRAEPLTMLVRFAPRQRQRSMNELFSAAEAQPELDPEGSLTDSEMAAYYHWVNQRRLAGADQSSFLVWFEQQAHAVVIGPTLPRAVQSSSAMNLPKLLALATS